MKTCVRIAAYAAAIFLLTGCFGGGLFISTQDGDWNDGGTWGNNSPGQSGNDYPGFNDDVVISSGTTVFHTTGESPRRVRINSNGELSTEGVLRVRGSYVNDGIHSGNNDIILQRNNDSIFGNGIISTTGLFDVTTFRQIYSGSSLTRSGGDVDCPNNSSNSNQGIFTLTNGVNITGNNNATFINAAGGVLYAGGEITVGTLIASENSNTVIYSRTDGTAQPIAISQNGYYNLSREGTDTLDVKTLDSDEDILGNLKLNGGLLRPLDSINLSIGGDFTMARVQVLTPSLIRPMSS